MNLMYKSLITEDEVNASLALIRQEHSRKRLLRLLSKLEITASSPHEGEWKVWISNKKTKRRVFIVEDCLPEHKITLADVLVSIRNRLNVPDTFEEYCNWTVGADESNPGDKFDYDAYRKCADRFTGVITKKEIISIPSLEIEPEPKIGDIKDEYHKAIIKTVNEHLLRRRRKHGEFIIRITDSHDHSRLQDILDTMKKNRSLMKQYGYDEKTEEFNFKLFPVPKTDREMEGIESDIDRFYEVIGEYNDYLMYLAKKYLANANENDLSNKGLTILFAPNDIDSGIYF